MTQKILVVNSSPRAESLSRSLVKRVVDGLKAKKPDTTVIERDLSASPFPHLTEQHLAAYFTPAEQRSPELQELIKLSDTAVDELLAADVLVIGSPMWNFGVPSVLKAWIDHVARAGRTFSYTANGPVGLATGKKAIIVSSRGGVYSQGPMTSFEHQESLLKSVLAFIGITDVEFIRAEGLAMGEEAVKQALATAEQNITGILAKAA